MPSSLPVSFSMLLTPRREYVGGILINIAPGLKGREGVVGVVRNRFKEGSRRGGIVKVKRDPTFLCEGE